MTGTEGYKVVSRPMAITIAAIALAIGAALVWAGMVGVESYGERISVLQAISPEEAATQLARDLRVLAIAFLIVLGGLSGVLGWYCRRALRSQSMPPIGSWIVQGQYVRHGNEARAAAWVLLALAGMLGIAALLSAWLLWRLAATI
jgi:hypothetical protein